MDFVRQKVTAGPNRLPDALPALFSLILIVWPWLLQPRLCAAQHTEPLATYPRPGRGTTQAPAGGTPYLPTNAQSTPATVLAQTDRTPAGSAPPIHGFVSSQNRFRLAGDDEDLDNYTYLSLKIGDASRQRLTGHIFARSSSDLDGRNTTRGYYVFNSVEDTYHHCTHAQLYYAYIDLHHAGCLDNVRVGRQLIFDAPQVAYFDGISLLTQRFRSLASLRLQLYAGAAVHPYESSPKGDALVGASIESSPWRWANLRLLWMQASDRRQGTRYHQDRLALQARISFTRGTTIHIRYTTASHTDNDLSLDGRWRFQDWDLGVYASYYRLFQPRNEAPAEFDPLYSSLGKLRPYWSARLIVDKGWGPHVFTQAGTEVRRLLHPVDESAFNHGFERYFLTLSVIDWPVENLQADLSAQAWDTQAKREDSMTCTGDITYRITKRFSASLGSEYSLYKYDYMVPRERERARSYFLKLRYRPVLPMLIAVSYAIEHSQLEVYHTFRSELRVTF